MMGVGLALLAAIVLVVVSLSAPLVSLMFLALLGVFCLVGWFAALHVVVILPMFGCCLMMVLAPGSASL
jgi:hypothetical protein